MILHIPNQIEIVSKNIPLLELFNETQGAWKTDPVYLKRKEYLKPVWLVPYPLLELNE